MKTAVSIPDALFEAADALARERRMSRSALYAEALERLLSERADDEVTTQLDAVYADVDNHGDPEAELDELLVAANVALLDDEW